LVSLVAPVIVSGNTVVALASEPRPYPAILLGELLATSDLPAGVVNVLTGRRAELVPTFATHAHLRGLSAVADAAERRVLDLGAAESVKRVRHVPDAPLAAWLSDAAQGLEPIRAFIEPKTTWHPIGA
ncbi:MAG: aldehyde dehydrogenase family protein, partial [Verrucomicrobia bacterium]|nr:aldehyde dehydrogenase family protein [Verrucomicrobiota bacterium]